MTKNANVVDDLGNRYVPTYAKRAKGLVKKGRARWVDENTICLACPPDDIDLEDTKMDKNKINPIEVNVNEQNEKVNANLAEKIGSRNGITVMDILERMDKIIAHQDDLWNIVSEIRELPVNESPEGGQDGANRAMAIGDICRAREATTQRMLAMLDKMYDDVVGRTYIHDKSPQSANTDALEAIRNVDFAGMMPETAKIIIDAMMGKTNT